MSGKQKKIYLCAAAQPEAAAALCSMAALIYLEQHLTAQGFVVQTGGADAAQCNTSKPDMALQLAGSVGGVGCVVYHPVTADWQRYGNSHRLAVLLEEQARRYRLLCRREVQAGANIDWLQAVQAPAALAVCNLPDDDVYSHLSLLQAQAKGFAQAVKLWTAETKIENAKGVENDETLF